jgi:hypothetical protein
MLITAYPSIDTAVRGMKLGARDYLGKPFSPDELRLVVRRALAEDALRRDNAALRRQLALRRMLGDSAPMVELRRTRSRRSAPVDATVLVTGESGTGKELVARALHLAGRRAGRAFVPGQLRRAGRLAARQRAVRPRPRRVHRRRHAKRGLVLTADRARCSSTRSPSCRSSCSPSCCARCRPARSSRSAAPTRSRSTSRVIAATNRDLRAEVGRAVPRGSVLPARGDHDRGAAAARAPATSAALGPRTSPPPPRTAPSAATSS